MSWIISVVEFISGPEIIQRPSCSLTNSKLGRGSGGGGGGGMGRPWPEQVPSAGGRRRALLLGAVARGPPVGFGGRGKAAGWRVGPVP